MLGGSEEDGCLWEWSIVGLVGYLGRDGIVVLSREDILFSHFKVNVLVSVTREAIIPVILYRAACWPYMYTTYYLHTQMRQRVILVVFPFKPPSEQHQLPNTHTWPGLRSHAPTHDQSDWRSLQSRASHDDHHQGTVTPEKQVTAFAQKDICSIRRYVDQEMPPLSPAPPQRKPVPLPPLTTQTVFTTQRNVKERILEKLAKTSRIWLPERPRNPFYGPFPCSKTAIPTKNNDGHTTTRCGGGDDDDGAAPSLSLSVSRLVLPRVLWICAIRRLRGE